MNEAQRQHDEYCPKCDLAEFAGITYEAAHIDATSPNRCKCGVPINVSHFCASMAHAWVSARRLAKGCLYHADDPYPAGCANCAKAVQR